MDVQSINAEYFTLTGNFGVCLLSCRTVSFQFCCDRVQHVVYVFRCDLQKSGECSGVVCSVSECVNDWGENVFFSFCFSLRSGGCWEQLARNPCRYCQSAAVKHLEMTVCGC